MPGLIGVIEFVDETREDYSSPTTSNFVYRMPQCRQTISSLEEVRSNLLVINSKTLCYIGIVLYDSTYIDTLISTEVESTPIFVISGKN